MKTSESFTTGDIFEDSKGCLWTFQYVLQRFPNEKEYAGLFVVLHPVDVSNTTRREMLLEEFTESFFRRHAAWDVVGSVDIDEDASRYGAITGYDIYSVNGREVTRVANQRNLPAELYAQRRDEACAQCGGSYSSRYEPVDPRALKRVLSDFLDD